MLKTHGIILAAGLSSRMGDFKPLMPLGNKTVIESTVDAMLLGGVASITVVLGFRSKEVEQLLRISYDEKLLTITYNLDYAVTDMLTSLKVGIKAMPSCDAFFILPGDMPVVDSNTFVLVRQEMIKTGAQLTFPTLEGYRKHPPLLSYGCSRYILDFQGEGGLRALWGQFPFPAAEVSLADQGCSLDVDTLEDYRKVCLYLRQKGQGARETE